MTSQYQTGVLAATTLLFTAASALAADINVPGDFATIGAAVAAAAPGDEITVGPGVYIETLTIDKMITLRSSDGPDATIIDAAGGGRTVNFAPDSSGAAMNGFTITGGSADTAAGMNISNNTIGVRVSNCIFVENAAANAGGGALRVRGEDAVVANCLFFANSGGNGGAVLVNDPPSSVTFVNSIFSANSANLGGAIAALGDGSTVDVVNCTFVRNSASNMSNCCEPNGSPGCNDEDCEDAVCAEDPFCCDTTWDELCAEEAIDICGGCTGNTGGAVRSSDDATVTLVNSIVRQGGDLGSAPVFHENQGVITATYSNIQGGWPGVGNNNHSGPFADANGDDDIPGTIDDDFRLQINGGGTVDGGDTTAGVGLMLSTDFLGQCRVVDQPEIADGGVPAFGAIDMGAIEAPIDAPVMEDPCPADLNNDGVVNAGDLAVLLAAWGACP